jgi:hypothetical protein
MGLDRRRQSGRLLSGSRIIVPGEQVFSTKNFQTTFQYKKGTPKDDFRELPQPSLTPTPLPSPTPPTPSPTPPTPSPTPTVVTFYILTEQQEVILTESGENITY